MRPTPYAPNGEAPPLVWYESPFGASEWMERSQAERLLEREFEQWVATLQHGKPPPRIVEHKDHLAEVTQRVRKRIEHAPAKWTRGGVIYCLRCGAALSRNGRPAVQLRLCQSVKVGPQ